MTTCDGALTVELKARRHTLGWTLKEVGERCAIDEGFLRDWEGGSGAPRLDACDAWAAALGLRLAFVPADRAARSGLAIDWGQRTVAVDGTPVRLTPMEWKALERLAAVPGEVVSHEALFRHLYGDARPYERRSTAIRVLITKLRRMLPLRIEAQWGRGYVVHGLAASTPVADAGDAGGRTTSVAPARSKPTGGATMPFPAPHVRAAMPQPVAERRDPAPRRPQTPAIRSAAPRDEELSVIERFLAERGATRCPDVTTSEQSPLVWDKVKRKWVRPEFDPQRHAMGS